LNVPDPKKVPHGLKFKKNSEVDAKDRTFKNMYQKVNFSQFSPNTIKVRRKQGIQAIDYNKSDHIRDTDEKYKDTVKSGSKSKVDYESNHKSMILPENNDNLKMVDLKAIHSEVLQNGLNKNYF